MTQVVSLDDWMMLKRLVGATTFSRGRAYASRGAVKSRQCSEDGSLVTGEIQGSAGYPYATSVVVTRSPSSQQLTEIEGDCSCPVGIDCKHAVALLLSDGVNSPSSSPRQQLTGTRQTAATEPALAAPTKGKWRVKDGGRLPARTPEGLALWEVSLSGLLAHDPEPVTEEPAIGLQFDLVLPSNTSAPASSPRLRIRPVVPGNSGNWVRTGISWGRLEYHFAYQRVKPKHADRHVLLLKELRDLGRADEGRSYYYSAEETVWFEAINSRRVWDVLAEARAQGIPLLQSGGQRPRPVTLSPTPGEVAIDVTDGDSGLWVEPQVTIGAEVPSLASLLLVGQPAHGIVWWDDPSELAVGSAASTGTGRLCLAPLAEAMPDRLRSLFQGGRVNVPDLDCPRFVRDALPALHRQVAVRSSDSSVELPEVAPPVLALTISHQGEHRLLVSWAWELRIGEAMWVEDLWETGRGAHQGEAEESLLTAATRAVASVPDLFEATMFGERLAPVMELADMAAVRFVADIVPELSELEGVEITQTGPVPDYREATAPPTVVLGGVASESGDWFDLMVTVTVDEEEVPFADLFVALAGGQSHLILPSGTFFSLDREELRQLAELIAEARNLHEAVDDGLRLSRFQSSLWEDLVRLGVLTAQARAWEESVQALANATGRTEHAVPTGLDADLRPYQNVGFQWLAFLHEHRLGGILADDMGLGKTIQALALMCHVKEAGAEDLAEAGGTAAPFLVVAPTSVVENWAIECRKFCPDLAVAVVTGTVSRRGVKLVELAEDADVIVTSYALFRMEYGDYEALEWAGMFLDEAQFAKNRTSQAYQRAKMLPVRFKVAMTGTPMENNLMELWSLLSITAPGLFANAERFTEHFRVPIERKGDAERLAQLRRRMRPLMLRRTKEQVAADLPDKQEQVLELDLNPKHRKIYQIHLQRERQKVLGLLGDMQKNRFQIFRSLTLLRQASLDPVLIDPKYSKVPSTKLDALSEMIGDIVRDEHRVLVFSQFTRFLTSAARRLDARGVDHCYLDGKTRNRPAVISRFREGDAPVFLISLKAGGFGLNLTEADYCILLDPWWNPATEAQAVDRVHRIGQTKKVMVYRLVSKDTIEEKVMALKARKAALFANVIDAGGFESGALTAEDIRSLLS